MFGTSWMFRIFSIGTWQNFESFSLVLSRRGCQIQEHSIAASNITKEECVVVRCVAIAGVLPSWVRCRRGCVAVKDALPSWERCHRKCGVNPTHIAVVTNSLFPICDNLLVVDWFAGKTTLKTPATGSGLRVRFLKLKGEDEQVKEKVLGVVGEEDVGEFSYGENISPERAQGFSIASLKVFPGQKELESVELEEGLAKVEEDVEEVVVVDYVLP